MLSAEIFNPAHYNFNPYSFPVFLTSAAMLFLGFVPLWRERASALTVMFCLLCFSIWLWLFSFAWMFCSEEINIAAFWAKTAYLGFSFLPAIIYHFTAIILKIYPSRKIQVILVWIISAGFFYLVLFTGDLLSFYKQFPWGYYPQYGRAGVFFVTYYFYIMASSLFNYYQAYLEARGHLKRRIKLFSLGFCIVTFASVDFLPKYGIPIYPFGFLPIFLFLILIAQGIWRYRLGDIPYAYAAREILRTISDALIMCDLEGTILIANPAACNLLKKERHQLVGANIEKIEDSFFHTDELETLIAHGSLENYDTVVGEGPESRFLNVSASLVKDQVPTSIAAVFAARDFTEAKKTREELNWFFLLSLELFSIMTLEGTFHKLNQAWEKQLGYSSRQLLGHSWFEFIEESDLAEAKKSFARLDHEDRVKFECRFKSAKGGFHWLSWTVTKLPSQGLIYAAARDITEARKSQESLRRKNVFLMLLHLIAVAANQAQTVEEAIRMCLEEVGAHLDFCVAHAYWCSDMDPKIVSSGIWYFDYPETFTEFKEETENRISDLEGLPERVLKLGKPVWISNVAEEAQSRRWQTASKAGLRAGFAFPVKADQKIVLIMEFFSKHVIAQDEILLEISSHIGAQLGHVFERRKGEEALRESEIKFRSVFQSSIEGIVLANAEGVVVAWNKSAEIIFGYKEQEILGKPLTLIMPQEFREAHSRGLERVHQTGHSKLAGKALELQGLRKDGSVFPMELSIATWQIAGERFISGFVRDISERKKSEEKLKNAYNDLEKRVKDRTVELSDFNKRLTQEVEEHTRTEDKLRVLTADLALSNAELDRSGRELQLANEQLKRMDAVRANFISIASHELRTPLTSIKGYVSLIHQEKVGSLNEQQKEFLGFVRLAADRLHRLVNDLLSISRIESGQVKIALEPNDLAKIVHDEMMMFKVQADDKKIAFSFEADKELKKVNCDSDLIREVIENLLSNAIKYTLQGGRVELRIYKHGETVRVAVQDTGIGVPKGHLDRIFEPFQTVKKSKEAGGESTGLGLALVKKIIEAHNGQVGVLSEEGKGSLFWFELPL